MGEPERKNVEFTAEQLDPYLGMSIKGFQVERLIGEGGMGRVYLAMQISLKRSVALKILSTSLVKQNPMFSDRFLREATIAAQIAHPNIVQVFDAGNTGGIYYIAMELIEGKSLDDIMRSRGVLPVKTAVDITLQASRGLLAAQKKNLVHRDIKPGNLMMTEDGIVKVADFGLAKNTEATAILTNAGQILGTPAFMSPEQGKGRPADHRSDQYSLGVTLFVMVTGTLPYKGESSVSIIYQHISDPVPDPAIRNPSLPRSVANLIMKMMAKNPDDRFQDFSAVVHALESLDLSGYSEELPPEALKVERAGPVDIPTVVFGDRDLTPDTMAARPEEGPMPELPGGEAATERVEDFAGAPEAYADGYWQTEGDIQARDIGFVLKDIARARQTGILTVSTEKKATSLYVDGEVVRLYTVDGNNAIRIGDILLRHKHIDEEQLNNALARQKEEKKLLGDILIDMGYISAEDRDRAVTMQMEEEFFELFTLREGQYKFIKQVLKPGEFDDRYRINGNGFKIADIIKDARQKVSEWKQIIHDLRDDKEIIVLSKEMADRLGEVKDPVERKILEKLTGESNLADIIDQMLLPKFKVFKIVGKYLEAGKVYRPSLQDLRNGAEYMLTETKYTTAAKLLERAFDMDPADVETISKLAGVYEKLYDAKRAAAFYKILARQHFDKGQEAEALGVCGQIIKLYPSDSFAYQKLYEYNIRKGNIQASLETGRGLLRTYVSEGKHNEAREVAQYILDKDRSDIGTLRKMVNINLEDGKIPEAIAGYERLEELVRNSADLQEQQKKTELIQIWEKILRLDPGRSDVRKKFEEQTKEIKPEGRKVPQALKIAAAAAALLAILGLVALYYELSARGAFKEAEGKAAEFEASGRFTDAAMEYGRIVSDYGMSGVSSEARRRQEALRAREEQRQRELTQIKEKVEKELERANKLLESGDVDGAAKIYGEIRGMDIPTHLKVDADSGLRRIDEIERQKVEKGFTALIDKARELQEKGRTVEKEGKLESLESARSMYLEALECLSKIEGKYSESWKRTVEGVATGIHGDMTGCEESMQKIYFTRADEVWHAADGTAAGVLGLLGKLLSLRGKPEIRAAASRLKEEVDEYSRNAASLTDDAWKEYRSAQNRRIEDRSAALDGVVAAVKAVLEKYPRSDAAINARFPVLLVTDPPGAEVSGPNIRSEGPTPSILLYPPYEICDVTVRKSGYEPVSFKIDSSSVLMNLKLKKTHICRIPASGPVEGTPLVHAGRVYFGDRAGEFSSVSWSFEKPRIDDWPPFKVDDLGGIKVSPCIFGDTACFCTAVKGQLFALGLKTGKPLWDAPFQAGRMVDHAPVVLETRKVIVIGDVGGTVYGVDMESGAIRWKAEIPGEVKINTAPVPAPGGAAVFVAHSAGIARIGAADGEIEWSYPISTIDKIHIAAADDFLVVTTGETVMALDARSATAPRAPVWASDGRARFTPPSVFEGRVFAGNEAGEVVALSLRDGRPAGKFESDGRLSFSLAPCLGRGIAFMISNPGLIAALDTRGEAFTLIWKYDTGSKVVCPPAIAGNYMYAGTSAGEILVLENN